MRRTASARESARWFTATLACIVAFWVLDLAVLRGGTPDPLDDTWEYGVVARSLLEGHGFRTLVIHPPLWTLRDATSHVPVLVHGPLLPVALVPVVAVAGARALDGIAWLAALFAVLAAIATFRLGERAHSSAVGAAAALLFTLSPLVLRAVHHDVALLAGAWLLALAMGLATADRPRGAAAGVALGLGALARPEFLLAAPVVFALARGARAPFAAAFLLCAVPWMAHTALATGSPFFNLSSYLLIGYWRERPGIGVMRDFALPPPAWPAALAASLDSLPAKWLEFFPHAAKRWLSSPSGATGWLVPVGWALATAKAHARPLAAAAAVLGAVPLAIMTLTLYDARYLVPFVPLAALGAAIGACELTEWAPAWMRRPRAWIGALVLLLLPGTGPALHEAWRESGELRARLADERAALAALPVANTSGLAFSDTPDFVAWTLRRPTVWVAAEEYAALPARDADDRPGRTRADLVWFHDLEGRGRARASAPAAPAAIPAPADTAATSP
jgi:hypothetical protein